MGLNSADGGGSAHDALLAAMKHCGIGVVATLPDDWIVPLLDRVEEEESMAHVAVGREAEAISIASGAFFAGVPSVALIGATGLFMCLGELATLNLRHQIPVFILASDRGSMDDHRIYQEVQGRRLKPTLDALDFPHFRIDGRDDINRIPEAYRWCRLQKRPVVGFMTRRLLKGEGK